MKSHNVRSSIYDVAPFAGPKLEVHTCTWEQELRPERAEGHEGLLGQEEGAGLGRQYSGSGAFGPEPGQSPECM